MKKGTDNLFVVITSWSEMWAPERKVKMKRAVSLSEILTYRMDIDHLRVIELEGITAGND